MFECCPDERDNSFDLIESESEGRNDDTYIRRLSKAFSFL
jgi:hypothetical protein